ncbi:MAG: universal stress protein, partial [Actinomycetes bacterium]
MSDPTYTTILCGTDGSESSFRAVDRAAAVARDAGATLLLVCVYRPMS